VPMNNLINAASAIAFVRFSFAEFCKLTAHTDKVIQSEECIFSNDGSFPLIKQFKLS